MQGRSGFVDAGWVSGFVDAGVGGGRLRRASRRLPVEGVVEWRRGCRVGGGRLRRASSNLSVVR